MESYWKSVSTPGEGLFVGEPLASPFGTPIITTNGSTVSFKTSILVPGYNYTLQCARSASDFAVISARHLVTATQYYTITAQNSQCSTGCWRLWGGPCVMEECNDNVTCATQRCYEPITTVCSFPGPGPQPADSTLSDANSIVPVLFLMILAVVHA